MKRKRRNNIITSLALICAIIMITLLPLPIAEAANFTVSKSNVSIENGKSTTITIKAPTHTGRIDITSSNSNIATVSDSSLWVENNSKVITISAKSTGTATITIKGELYDETIGGEAEYSRTISVNVTKAASTNDTGSNNSSSNSGGKNNTSGSTGGSSVSNNTGSSSGVTQNSVTKENQNSNNSATTQSSSKPAQNNTNQVYSSEQISEVEENVENNTNEQVNATEENVSEEVEGDIVEENKQMQFSNEIQENTSSNSRGKIIMIVIIGFIAFIMVVLGIGISKNILKK